MSASEPAMDLFGDATSQSERAAEQRALAELSKVSGVTITSEMRERAARALFERNMRRSGLAQGREKEDVAMRGRLYNRLKHHHLADVDFMIKALFGEEGESGGRPA